jgi:ribosome-associated protein
LTPHSDAPAGSPVAADSAVLHDLVMHQLDEDQAIEVVSIPLAGISSIADHMVIASGRSSRHVAAMAEKIASRIKQDLKGSARVEGLPTADWVLIDAGDVIVHLFRPEVRSFYNLERMWGGDSLSPAGASSAAH